MTEKINDQHRLDFEALKEEVRDKNITLVPCTDKTTGIMIPTVCSVDRDDGSFIPLAKLFLGNPYEELNPP